eukprot:COSAG02_NODE_273_length_26316_cov_13.661060_6_plen_103_part_00
MRTVRGVDFSLCFICVQSVSEFLWDRLRASIQFPVMPKRAQYARFSGECTDHHGHHCAQSRQPGERHGVGREPLDDEEYARAPAAKAVSLVVPAGTVALTVV